MDNGLFTNYYVGPHPVVYSSAGSHAIYRSEDLAESDATGSDICKPAPDFVMAFVPGAYQNSSANNFEPPYDQIDLVDSALPFSVRTYELTDIFEYDGLWDQRTNDEVFNMPFPLPNLSLYVDFNIINPFYNPILDPTSQKMLCTFGCIDDAPTASAPWNGDLGVDPMDYIKDEIGSFGCCDSDPCTTLSFPLASYTYSYNQYLCDYYHIEVKRVEEECSDMVIVLAFESMGVLKDGNDVSWEITSSTGNVEWDCYRCDLKKSLVELTLFDVNLTTALDAISTLSITATSSLLECGEVTSTLIIPVIENIIVINDDCLEMGFKYEESPVNKGFGWTFFGYDDIVNISGNGKEATFQTDLVIQKYNELNSQTDEVLPKELYYKFDIIDLSTDEIESSFGKVAIPECNDQLGLAIFPNPSANIIYVNILKSDYKGSNPNQYDFPTSGNLKGKEFLILDNNLRVVGRKRISSNYESIDISHLKNGIYYLQTNANDGTILAEKFIVQGN